MCPILSQERSYEIELTAASCLSKKFGVKILKISYFDGRARNFYVK
tara:strand:- start:243 stop:380 length:138 start_codon:yes stop_codon:yes gene_type:complete